MEDLNPEPTVEVLYPAQADLAEGPFYEEATSTLIWVDILKGTVNFLDPIAKSNRSVQCPFEKGQRLSIAIPVQGSSTLLVVLLANQICLVDRNTGGITEVLEKVEPDKLKNHTNDAKCDSCGRLWLGTMGNTTGPLNVDFGGGFYSYSKGVLTKYANAALSNGIGWNPAEDALYQIDTFALTMFKYNFSKEEGTASDREKFLDFTSLAYKEEAAFADGMCTDTKGRLWVAIFNGGSVMCWDPETKEKLMTVKIPGAKKVTSCCFGGPNYEWMFVTTGRMEASSAELEKYPHSGDIFIIKDLGARGAPPNLFKHKL